MARLYCRPALFGLVVGVCIILALVEPVSTQQGGPAKPTLLGENNRDETPDPTLYEEESEDQPVSQGTIETPCVNLSPDCEEWAKLGECWNNPSYMVKYCSAACWSCPQVHDCTDVQEGICPTWAAFDQCRNNTAWMEKNCFRSCGLCRQANLTNAMLEQPVDHGKAQENVTASSRPALVPGEERPTVEPPAPISSSMLGEGAMSISVTPGKMSETAMETTTLPAESIGISTTPTGMVTSDIDEMGMQTMRTLRPDGSTSRSMEGLTPGTTTLSSGMPSSTAEPPSSPKMDDEDSPSKRTPMSDTSTVSTRQTSTDSKSTQTRTKATELEEASTNPPSTQERTSPTQMTQTASIQPSTTGKTLAMTTKTTEEMTSEKTTTVKITSRSETTSVTPSKSLPTEVVMTTAGRLTTTIKEKPTSKDESVSTLSSTTTAPIRSDFTTLPTQSTTAEIIYDEFSSSTSRTSTTTLPTSPLPTTTTTATTTTTSPISTIAAVIGDLSTSTVETIPPSMTSTMKPSTRSQTTSSRVPPSVAGVSTDIPPIATTDHSLSTKQRDTSTGVSLTVEMKTETTTASKPTESTYSPTLDASPSTVPSTMKSTVASTSMATMEKRYPCSNKWGSDDDCDLWASIGECRLNYPWMKENCLRACGYCSEYEQCVNSFEDNGSCNEWAAGGECELNPGWMKKNCFMSCGYCPELGPSAPSTTPGMMFTFPTVSDVEDTDIYISNETHILKYAGNSVETIISQERGSIVGLAIDVRRQLLFWSDMGWATKGIYRSTLSGQNITRIISTDVLEVNGLTLDYASGHVYWTDAQRRRIEVADYDGNNRRILISGGLENPRSIVADPLHGFLFWGDQGTRKIERSSLDGRERIVVVGEGLIWPNQLAIDFNNNQLLYVDGWNKTLSAIRVDRSDRPQKIADLSKFAQDNPIFGLALGEGFAYVSIWGTGSIVKVPLNQESEPVQILTGLSNECLFSLASTDARGQTASLNPCSWKDRGGCSNLCLPTGVINFRCSCPSLGGLVIKNKTCVAPTEVLLYAEASTGEVSFVDPEASDKETYLVAKSSRPVAVGYDPVDQYVYWSDIKQRSIHRAFLNGSGHQVMLNASDGLGFVDGLFVDWVHRKLYFTNMDFVTIDGTAFTWHRVEVINLDGTGRRSVVTDVEQPRGLWVDMNLGYLYYTDWGRNARVMRTRLDGSDPVVIKDGLENPNGVVAMDDSVYIIDSEAKGREAGRDGARGSLFSWGQQSEEWTKLNIQLHTPYGISKKGEKLFITDWGTHALWSYDVTTGLKFPVLLNAKELMGVFFSEVSITDQTEDPCATSSCGDVCFQSVQGDAQCSCSSYDASVQGPLDTCSQPVNFVLIADMNEIRLVAQSPADGHVYTVVSGNRYASSYSALVWDAKRNKFYFSDVNRRVIYESDLSGAHRLLYNAGDVVDGMVIVDDDLYWTGQEEGALYRFDLNQRGENATAIVTGLNKPKALVFSSETRELLWSEIGVNGSIKRSSLDGGDIVEIWKSTEKPEALFLDDRLKWVGFTIHKSNNVYTCPLSTGNCSLTTNLSQKTGVASNIIVTGDYIYYSDWDLGSIVRVDMKGFTRAVEVIKGLTRPTAFAIVSQAGLNDMCSRDHMCSDLCITLPLDYACACWDGRDLLFDGMGCYETSQSTMVSKSTTSSSATPSTISTTPKTTMSTQATSTGLSGTSTLFKSTSLDGISTTQSFISSTSSEGAIRTVPVDGLSTSTTTSTDMNFSTSMRSTSMSDLTTIPTTSSSTRASTTSSMSSIKSTPTADVVNGSTPFISTSISLPTTKTMTRETTTTSEGTMPSTIKSTTPTLTPSTMESTTVPTTTSTTAPSTASTSSTSTTQSSTSTTSTVSTTTTPTTIPSTVTSTTMSTPSTSASTTKPSSTSSPTSTTLLPTTESMSTTQTTTMATTKSTTPSTTSRPTTTTSTTITSTTTSPTTTTIRTTASTVASTTTSGKTTRSTTTQASTTRPSVPITSASTPTTQPSSAILSTETPSPSTKLPEMSSTESTTLSTPETSTTGPSFAFCPANRTVPLERGSEEPVVVWWLTPKAINAEGSLIETLEANRQPGSSFKKGTTLITYTATDQKGQRARCVFFVNVIVQEFSCSNTPAPLNGVMDCGVEEFVYTCQMKCKPGYVPSSELLAEKHFCRTTGWQPEFPSNYSSQSCLKSQPLQEMMPVVITYSGTCEDRLDPSFEEAFVTKLSWRFRQLGLCPEADGEMGYGLCKSTNYKLSCDRSLGVRRKKRQVERVKVNVTVSVPESTTGSPQAGQLQQMRANIEQLVLSEQLNLELEGEQYRAQQVGPSVPEVVGCPPGHSRKEDMCLLCPVGAFLDSDSGQCVGCSPGYYQPLPGRDGCEKCPKETVTGEGAFSSRQCVKKPDGPIPTEASLKGSDSLSVPIVIGLSVAAGIVFIITITLFICTVRKILRSKGKMKLDQEKAVMNGTNAVFGNPAFVARPVEETANVRDPTPRYLAVTKVPANGDGASVHAETQPVQYRRLPSGQVVRVVPVSSKSKVRMPPVKSRKYDMKHMPQVIQVPVAQPTQPQGMYRKYQPGQSTGWQSLSQAEKLTQ